MGSIIKNKYLILRRISQLSILFLYFAANAYGWKILVGNLSFSKLFNTIPLSDPFAVLQMLFAGAAISADLILGVFVVLFLYGVIGGRAYCSWVCPVNMITDLAAWVRRKTHHEKDNLISTTKTRKFRYAFLVVLLIASAFIGAAAFEFISPIGIFTRGVAFSLGFGWIWLLTIFIFDAFVLKNGWCGHICPVGAMYSLVGSKSLIRVYHNKDNCTACGECLNICPETQVLTPVIDKKSDYINGIECTNCGRCIEVCNDNALNFSIRKYINSKGENNEKTTN
ncbi:periplasmic nitrate reductase, NapH subunit [Nautilia profundicola AmH]|uniref:Periplasmic nitrate reductase, NapH subunit n=1 Tax=Nautilia profundicola (strain ATCC BAA-1463 / DSM 18972 / AmH) TaxID=598659 RepID=B9L8L2_NAUPA|nr:quinol dehydrogenase ferredoxin subunit NapH [Nautilia profundicola]ACM92102.1 periplasmic nitrate reductase, NapH subunit [Nautilia profundicola AmH]